MLDRVPTARNGPKLPIRSVTAKNFLSLADVTVRLNSFNVLVGPNGSGKSNFLSVFRFLGEVARTDLAPALQTLFGGFAQTRFRGKATGRVEISLSGEITEYARITAPDEYSLSFRAIALSNRRQVLERHEDILLKRSKGRGRRFTLQGSRFEIATIPSGTRQGAAVDDAKQDRPEQGEIGEDTSALSVLRRIGRKNDTQQVSQLADVFERFRLFDPVVERARQPAVMTRSLRLSPDASNLAAVLATMREDTPDLLSALEDDVRQILPGFCGFHFERLGGSTEAVTVNLREGGLADATPLARASFGTVRAVALLTMLRDPDPPRLTCLEEVDHGLHPYALDVLVERLRDAAVDSQIVVATHSPAFVNRVKADELIIFERDGSGGSRVIQPDLDELKQMQEESGLHLGELWFSGTLGGVPT